MIMLSARRKMLVFEPGLCLMLKARSNEFGRDRGLLGVRRLQRCGLLSTGNLCCFTRHVGAPVKQLGKPPNAMTRRRAPHSNLLFDAPKLLRTDLRDRPRRLFKRSVWENAREFNESGG